MFIDGSALRRNLSKLEGTMRIHREENRLEAASSLATDTPLQAWRHRR